MVSQSTVGSVSIALGDVTDSEESSNEDEPEQKGGGSLKYNAFANQSDSSDSESDEE